MISKILYPNERTTVEVTENTQFVVLFENYSDEKMHTMEFQFKKPGVKAEILCVYKLPEKGKISFTTIANHLVPNTSCSTVVRGVLADKSESYYIGKIIIKKEAQQTSSYLSDRVLVLGEGIKNNSEPILEIDADDVSASHGASTGKINKEEIYHLETRGLTETEASELIVEGFFNQVLQEIVDPKIREVVFNNVKS